MSRLYRTQTLQSSAVALCVSIFILSPAIADEPGFRRIFNGKDLTGWRVRNVELAGKTASGDGRFAVKDGALVITGSTDTPPKVIEIETVESFDGDFTIRLRIPAPPQGCEQRPAPARQGLQTSTPRSATTYRVGPYKTLKNYKDGDWNAIEVIVHGNTKPAAPCNGEILEARVELPGEGDRLLCNPGNQHDRIPGTSASGTQINATGRRSIRITVDDRALRPVRARVAFIGHARPHFTL